MIKIKRVYETPSRDDGYRILIDRLWPRGLTKEKARVDLWMKDIAPSSKLRKWFMHDPKKWEEFQKKYRQELESKKDLLEDIKHIEKEHKTVTLVYGAKEERYNDAVVLEQVLK